MFIVFLSSAVVYFSFSHILLIDNTTCCITNAYALSGTSCLGLFSHLLSQKPKLQPLFFFNQLLTLRYSAVTIENDPNNKRKPNDKASQTWSLNMIHCPVFFFLRSPLLLRIFSICFNKIYRELLLLNCIM